MQKESKGFMKRTLQLAIALIIVLAAVQLIRQYRELQVTPGSSSASALVLPPAPEEELAPFREPRFAKTLKIYAQYFPEYAKLRYLPIAPTDKIEDVVKVLQPVLERQINNDDEQTRALAKKYGDDAIKSLGRHLAIVLLRFSGLDGEHYLAATARDRANRLYVPYAKAQYLRACSNLLPNIPIVIDETNQEGLHQIFDGISALQLKGPAGANNQIVGWNDDAKIVRIQFTEARANDLDAGIQLLRDRDTAAAHSYYNGGILLGSMIFTTPPPEDASKNQLIVMFNVVVRTSNDFYTIRVFSNYDPISDAWHLQEATRCNSPRPSLANPMVF